MTTSVTHELAVCTDCLLFIANADLPDDVEARAAIVAGADRWARYGHLVPGDVEHGFSRASCDHCRSALAGDRHQVLVLGDEPATWADVSALFVTEERSQATITRLADSAPQWLRDAVRSAHGDQLPDEWVYATCAETAAAGATGVDFGDEVQFFEFVAGLVPLYTAELIRWYADRPSRLGYADEALDNAVFGKADDLLAFGFRLAAEYVVCTFVDAVAVHVASSDLTPAHGIDRPAVLS